MKDLFNLNNLIKINLMFLLLFLISFICFYELMIGYRQSDDVRL